MFILQHVGLIGRPLDGQIVVTEWWCGVGNCESCVGSVNLQVDSAQSPSGMYTKSVSFD